MHGCLTREKKMMEYSSVQPEKILIMYFIHLTYQNTSAFKKVAIISHPRAGECAFGFITSSMILQVLVYAQRSTDGFMASTSFECFILDNLLIYILSRILI